MKLWFVGENGDSEITRLYDSTNEIIRRMTRYAQQISERYTQGASRVEDYRHLAQVFLQCTTLNEAHNLSAMVFGPEKMLHLKGLPDRATAVSYTHLDVYKRQRLICKVSINEAKKSANYGLFSFSQSVRR